MAWLVTLEAMLDRQALYTVLVLTLVVAGCTRASRGGSRDEHKRGVVVIDAARRGRRRRGAAGRGLALAGTPIAFIDETKHFKLIGTTGTGKSTAISELLGGALGRGDRAIFADPDGGYRARFFNRSRGDIVLNPFDHESVTWDPFAEIVNSYDVEELAAGLIPATGDPGANEWREYARTFLAAVLRRCHAGSRRNCSELWRLLSTAAIDELRGIVADTPAQSFLDAENLRMFGSIRSVTMSAIAALGHVQAQRSTAFSVRSWVGRSGVPGALFITYRAGQIAALRAMIATWMRIAIFEAMNAPENHDQRLWFVIDELDALGAIEGLKDALARMRKFGGRCVLGFQSIAQVSGTYGAAAAQTIVENCGNTLILRCSSSENGGTSQFASKLIGDREIVRRQTSRGSDREAGFSARTRRSRNISEQHVVEAAVMASEIEQLPDLCGYLKTASSPAWRRVALTHTNQGTPS